MKVNGWIASNIRTIITLLVIIIGFTVTATTVSYKVGSNREDIDKNTEQVDTLSDDIGVLSGDIQEVKAILSRIERKVGN